MNKIIALVSTLLLLPYPTFALEVASNPSSQKASENSYCQMESENGELSEKQLQSLVSKITVKVIGDNNGGSGTLLGKQGNSYLVLTNAHIVRGVNSISLKTADGKTYPAEIVKQTNFEKSDLALLKFQSSSNYCLVDVIGVVPHKDMPVLAAGFYGEKGEIVFRTGEVKQVLGQSLKEGYQIGYSSDIEQGMSGGPIISSQGMIVGVNGRGAYPILNSGYVYQNGSRPNEAEIQEMRKLSWGIPASTFLAQVNGEILTAYGLPLPANSIEVPQTQLTAWLGDLEQKAKQFTVRIDSSSKGNGSGVIIAKNKNGNTYTYTVLTAAHVVCERRKGDDPKKPCPDNKYEIIAPDGKNKYSVDESTIKREEGVDLAVVKFVSEQNYEVATLANYNPNDGDYIFTAGFPKLENNAPWRFTMGRVFSKEQGLFSRKSIFNKEPEIGNINSSSGFFQNVSSLTKGYELIYSSITSGGMSGGPVLDSEGRVIGIHGQAEAEQAQDEKTKDCGIHGSECLTQIGYSLGVPISKFLGFEEQFNVKRKKDEPNPKPPQLDSQKIESIKQTMLSADVSKGNASASAWLERGNQLWRLGSNEEAVKAFDKAINLKPSFIHLAYYGKALALGSLKKYEESLHELQLALEYKSDYTSALLLQSSAYRDLNKFDDALFALDKLIKMQINNPIFYSEKSHVLKRLQRYREAKAAITKAIDISPSTEVFYINRGNFYSDQKKWNLALDDYKKAIELNSQSSMAYMNLGTVYLEQNKLDLAEVNINKAIDINPNLALAYTNRGKIQSKKQNMKLALGDYNKAIELDNDLPQAYYGRAEFYFNQNKVDLAKADFNKVIGLNPKDVNAYSRRGIFYFNQKKWNLAEADFNKCIELAFDSPLVSLAYMNRGIVYEKQQKLDFALRDFNKAIEHNPQLANPYLSRGNFYSDQRRFDLALVDYNKVIEINPQYSEAYYNRANLYSEQNKFNLAETDYTKAIIINPQYSEAYHNRANLYSEQNKFNLAEADYIKAIEINPQYADAYYNRGNLYSKQKKWDLALADYTKAIVINPQDAQAYYNRGVLYKELKKWDLALADFNKILQVASPEYPGGYFSRGTVYALMGDKQKAIPDLQRAAQLFQSQGNTAAYEQAMNLLKSLQ